MKTTINAEWNLSALLNGDNDEKAERDRKEIEKTAYSFINKWRKREDYLKDPKILKEALNEYEDWMRKYGFTGNEGYYFTLRFNQDQNNPEIKAKNNKIEDFGKKITNDVKFFELKLAKIPESNQKKFLESKNLEEYKHYLDKLFKNSKYLLGEEEEKIMSLKEKTSHSNWEDMLSGFLAKEERPVLLEDNTKAIKSFSDIETLTSNKNKQVREFAAKEFNAILEKHKDVAEAEINSILENKKTDDQIRKLPRPDSLRHINDDIETEIVDKLIDSVSKRFDISHKFFKLKAKLMKQKKIGYYERNVPYGEIDKKYTYNESIELLNNVFENLDSQFKEIFKEFIKNGQIDAFPRKGKRAGAFCMHNLLVQPTYILLNHTDKLKDALTLAHEVGHGINNELMKRKQNALNFDTPKSTAEVASTFMEDFVLQELLKEANDELKLTLLMEKLNADISTIFRQTAFYRFEQELHKNLREKGYLKKEEIGELFKKHMNSYMGEAVDVSEAGNWWIYVPHFRMIFYVYSYVSGLLISKSMQNQVKKDKKFIEKVKDFLASGTSDSPKNIFLNLGIDISDPKFWNKGLDEIGLLLNETESLAKKLGKIKD